MRESSLSRSDLTNGPFKAAIKASKYMDIIHITNLQLNTQTFFSYKNQLFVFKEKLLKEMEKIHEKHGRKQIVLLVGQTLDDEYLVQAIQLYRYFEKDIAQLPFLEKIIVASSRESETLLSSHLTTVWEKNDQRQEQQITQFDGQLRIGPRAVSTESKWHITKDSLSSGNPFSITNQDFNSDKGFILHQGHDCNFIALDQEHIFLSVTNKDTVVIDDYWQENHFKTITTSWEELFQRLQNKRVLLRIYGRSELKTSFPEHWEIENMTQQEVSARNDLSRDQIFELVSQRMKEHRIPYSLQKKAVIELQQFMDKLKRRTNTPINFKLFQFKNFFNHKKHSLVRFMQNQQIIQITGNNGEGKSSIFYALDLSLFGKHSEFKLKEAINNDFVKLQQAYGLILVEVNGTEYIVLSSFEVSRSVDGQMKSSSSHRIFQIESGQSELSWKEGSFNKKTKSQDCTFLLKDGQNLYGRCISKSNSDLETISQVLFNTSVPKIAHEKFNILFFSNLSHFNKVIEQLRQLTITSHQQTLDEKIKAMEKEEKKQAKVVSGYRDSLLDIDSRKALLSEQLQQVVAYCAQTTESVQENILVEKLQKLRKQKEHCSVLSELVAQKCDLENLIVHLDEKTLQRIKLHKSHVRTTQDLLPLAKYKNFISEHREIIQHLTFFSPFLSCESSEGFKRLMLLKANAQLLKKHAHVQRYTLPQRAQLEQLLSSSKKTFLSSEFVSCFNKFCQLWDNFDTWSEEELQTFKVLQRQISNKIQSSTSQAIQLPSNVIGDAQQLLMDLRFLEESDFLYQSLRKGEVVLFGQKKIINSQFISFLESTPEWKQKDEKTLMKVLSHSKQVIDSFIAASENIDPECFFCQGDLSEKQEQFEHFSQVFASNNQSEQQIKLLTEKILFKEKQCEGFSQEEYSNLSQEYMQRQKRKSEAETQQAKKKELETQIQELITRRKEFTQAIEEAVDQQSYFNAMLQILQNDLKQLVHSTEIDSLVKNINRILEQASFPFQVDASPDNFQVVDKKGNSISNPSSGQKFIIDLIGKLVFNSPEFSQFPRANFIVIDETLQTLDKHNQSLFLPKILRLLHQIFPNIFLISHQSLNLPSLCDIKKLSVQDL